MIAYILKALISLVSIALVIRLFGVEIQGLIAFGKMLTAAGYFSLFTLGLNSILIRKIEASGGRNGQKEESYQWLSLISRRAIAIGLLLGFLILAAFSLPASQNAFLLITGLSIVPAQIRESLVALVALSLPFQFFGRIAQASLMGVHDFKAVQAAEVMGSALRLLSILLFWFQGWDSHQLVLIVVGVEVICSLFLGYRLNLIFPLRAWMGVRAAHLKLELKTELEERKASVLLEFLNQLATPYLAMQVLGAAGLGLFDALFKLTKFLKIFFEKIGSSVLPAALASEWRKGQGSWGHPFARACFLMAFLVLPLMGVLMGISNALLRIWLGPLFATYGQELNLGFLAMLPLIFISLQSVVLSSKPEVSQAENKVNIFEDLFGLPLLYLMTAHFGVLGIFLNRLLVAWFGWIPRIYFIVKFYNVPLGQLFMGFRWTAPLSLLTAIILQSLASFSIHWALLFAGALLSLVINWSLIYKFSEAEEKNLVVRILSDFKFFLRKKPSLP